MHPTIPHKIHRIWLGREMPAEFVEYGRAWERLHPGWEVRTWGDEDLDWLQNRAEFDRAPRFTTKANIARYEIVHREGGLYVDCDFEPLRPIDEVLADATLVVGEEAQDRLNNAFFAATPGHPVLTYAVDELPRSFNSRFDDLSIRNSGPEFWSRCVRRASAKHDITPRVLTRDQIYPYGFDDGQRRLKHADFDGAYAVHHWAHDKRLVAPVTPPNPRWSFATMRGALDQAVRERSRQQFVDRVKPRVFELARRVRKLPLPRVWGTYVGHNRVLVRTARGVAMLAFADDLSVTPKLLTEGEFDTRFVRFLEQVLEPGDVAVDVGANIGLFTIEMARQVGRNGRVFAFEPNPEVHEVLRDNVYLNGQSGLVSCEVRCRPVGVGAERASATLRVRAKHRGMGSIVTPDGGPAPGDVDEVDVEIVDLDHELRGVTEIKLVKIDVEGAELGVLLGMARLLAERRVRFVDIELVDRHVGPGWDDLADELRRLRIELGASFLQLRRDGPASPIDLEAALNGSDRSHLVIVLPGLDPDG